MHPASGRRDARAGPRARRRRRPRSAGSRQRRGQPLPLPRSDSRSRCPRSLLLRTVVHRTHGSRPCRVHSMKVTEVAPDVFAVEGQTVNWALIAEGDALTLVDAGWPGYLDEVLASIREIGHRLSHVEAVLVTHAHVDHIGSLPRLLEQH